MDSAIGKMLLIMGPMPSLVIALGLSLDKKAYTIFEMLIVFQLSLVLLGLGTLVLKKN